MNVEPVSQTVSLRGRRGNGASRPAQLLIGCVLVGAVMLLTRPTLRGSTSVTPILPSISGTVDGTLPSGVGSLPHPPLTMESITEIIDSAAAKPRFDGVLLGWTVAPYASLKAAGIGDRNLSRKCEPYPAGEETPTALDFTVGYLPPEIKMGPVAGPIKWLCASEALSVLVVYNVATPLGAGQIIIERLIQGRRVVEMDVPNDSVEGGSIGDTPAIIFHPFDDATGLGMGRIVLIEDDFGQEFTILSVTADEGLPFAELVKIAEGIK